MSTCRLTAGDLAVVINPAAGGRLSSLRWGPLELLARVGPAPFEWGSFIMAPYAGRVRHGRLTWNGRTHALPVNNPPHALHGLVLDVPWDVEEITGTSARLRCHFDDRWPWRGHVDHRIQVRPDGLDAVLEVHSRRDEMPAWCGWHPWFARTLSRGRPVRIDVDARGILRRDETGIATTETVPVVAPPWDDCFTGVRWPITLTWPGAVRLEITADTDYAVLFTKKQAGVCVEPQTAPPDAVALDRYALVAPGDPLVAHMSWTFTAG